MAIHTTCDGCNKAIPAGTGKRLGLAIVRDYCAECAPMVETFMKGLDTLHAAAVEIYQRRKRTLVMTIVRAYPGIGLPDVPDSETTGVIGGDDEAVADEDRPA